MSKRSRSLVSEENEETLKGRRTGTSASYSGVTEVVSRPYLKPGTDSGETASVAITPDSATMWQRRPVVPTVQFREHGAVPLPSRRGRYGRWLKTGGVFISATFRDMHWGLETKKHPLRYRFAKRRKKTVVIESNPS